MLQKFLKINQILRSIRIKSLDAFSAEQFSNDVEIFLSAYVKEDLEQLAELWTEEKGKVITDKMLKSIDKDSNWYSGILFTYLPAIEKVLDKQFQDMSFQIIKTDIMELLHPIIVRASYIQYQNELYRDAVFNAFLAIGDLIRSRTGIDADGNALITKAFSLNKPILVIADLSLESGQNTQKGFIQILCGAFQAIRNPPAHSMEVTYSKLSSSRYLVFASLIVDQIENARIEK